MAYRIKRVRFQNCVRQVLLQNENGPCPLLAAANVFLLKGVVSLPPSSMRCGAVSIEELVTILADRALKRCEQITQTTTNRSSTINKEKASIKRLHDLFSSSSDIDADSKISVSLEEEEALLFRNKQSQHMIDELMQILPKLQYGMDVNPKFTQGPEGYEFTIGLTAFDILGVDLVHGWLISPQDDENTSSIAHVIGTKTYNELIEMVILGNDAMEQMKNNQHCTTQTKNMSVSDSEPSNDAESKHSLSETPPSTDNFQNNELCGASCSPVKLVPSPTTTTEKENQSIEPKKKSITIEQETESLVQKKKNAEEAATRGHVVQSFLTETGHQLTMYGLEQLRKHLHEGDLSVFFRNNHFSTMMKHDGQLFLLVTDLGYANVDEVVWERLDAIDGNTDYFSSNFMKPNPMAHDDYIVSVENSATLTPEQMLARRGETDMDYHLAMQLSKNNNGDVRTNSAAHEDAMVMAAVTEISLSQDCNSTVNGGIPVNDADHLLALSMQNSNNANGGAAANDEADRIMALNLENQYASERLARQLHHQELLPNRAQRTYHSGSRRNAVPAESSGSGCIIS